MARRRPPMPGFTLIEMMVVVAIACVLAALALPSYADHITRSKLTEATSSLAQLRVMAEQHFADHGTYSGFTLPAVSDTKYFTYSLTSTATTYTIRARGVAAEGMGGFAYAISRGNARATTALPGGWAGVNSDCWVLSRGGAC